MIFFQSVVDNLTVASFPDLEPENLKNKFARKKQQPTIYVPLEFPNYVVNSFCQHVNGNRQQLSAWIGEDEGYSSPVVKVSDHDRHFMSSSPVPLKTRSVGARGMLNLSSAETSSRWWGGVVRRGESQLRYLHRHLTMVQNYEVRR
ncbi:uncharacterized protein TNCV_2386571 [Trichonephila clavipes]|nr:uncharacterized protein TNCV_2386571 [Trichonephila clavipes]